jgi:hypothetical protein
VAKKRSGGPFKFDYNLLFQQQPAPFSGYTSSTFTLVQMRINTSAEAITPDKPITSKMNSLTRLITSLSKPKGQNHARTGN